jgi:hypothetical protein
MNYTRAELLDCLRQYELSHVAVALPDYVERRIRDLRHALVFEEDVEELLSDVREARELVQRRS